MLCESNGHFSPEIWRADFAMLEAIDKELHFIISRNLRHSKTFTMYNTIFKHTGRDALFLPYELPDTSSGPDIAGAAAFVEWGRRSGRLQSVCISDPFKFHLFRQFREGEVSPQAKLTRATNLICFTKGIRALNLDGVAMIEGLSRQQDFSKIKSAAFIGAGGVSTAVCAELGKQLERVLIVEITSENTTTMVGMLRESFPHIEVATLIRPADADFSSYDFVYNGSGIGKASADPVTATLSPLKSSDKFATTGVAIDANYTPSETMFLKQMRAHGYTTVNGLRHMLGSVRCHIREVYGEAPEWELLEGIVKRLGILP